jgi:tetratricopeptide (TPR) repeat protein
MTGNLTRAAQPTDPHRTWAEDWIASPRLLCAIVLALTFLAYLGTLTFEFVHDDRGQILDNPAVHSWRYAAQYFTAHVWAGVAPEDLGNYYRPLFLLWLRLNAMVFGSHAWGWHLSTVLVHLVVTLLVYLLAFQLLGNPLDAAISALIFGLHPVHIEAVAWVSGVTEPLLGMLLVASFLCHLKERAAGKKARRWWAASLGLYILAVLEKETALVLPMIVFAYELLPGVEGRPRAAPADGIQRVRRALWSATPYLVPIPFYLAARTYALKGFSHVMTALPVATVIYTWPSLLWFWVKHLAWPVGLSTFYDLPSVTLPNFANFTLPALGVIGIAVALFWGAKRSSEVALASLWIVLPLIPLLNLRVFLRDDFAHDRYLYLSSIGLAIVATVALRRLCFRRANLLGQPAALVVAALVLAPLLAFGTAYQSIYFQNNLVFYQHNLRYAPQSILVKTNLATVWGEAGRYDAALQLYKEALESDPGFWYANYNLGYTYYKLGNLGEAERYLLRAIQIRPNKPDQYLYLGICRLKLGRAHEAAAAIRRAIQIRPDGYGQHFALGLVLKLEGDLQGALAQFQAELALNPQHLAARREIAEMQASEDFERAGNPGARRPSKGGVGPRSAKSHPGD